MLLSEISQVSETMSTHFAFIANLATVGAYSLCAGLGSFAMFAGKRAMGEKIAWKKAIKVLGVVALLLASVGAGLVPSLMSTC